MHQKERNFTSVTVQYFNWRDCAQIFLCVLTWVCSFGVKRNTNQLLYFIFSETAVLLGGGLSLNKSAILTVMLNLQLFILCHWTYPLTQPKDKLQYSSSSREQSWAGSNSLLVPSFLLSFIKCLWFSFCPGIVVAVFFCSIFYFPC